MAYFLKQWNGKYAYGYYELVLVLASMHNKQYYQQSSMMHIIIYYAQYSSSMRIKSILFKIMHYKYILQSIYIIIIMHNILCQSTTRVAMHTGWRRKAESTIVRCVWNTTYETPTLQQSYYQSLRQVLTPCMYVLEQLEYVVYHS